MRCVRQTATLGGHHTRICIGLSPGNGGRRWNRGKARSTPVTRPDENDLEGSPFFMLTVQMQHEDATIAQLPETVDYDNAPLVGGQCEDLVNRGCTTLVLDASQVQYMDSSGISMLITLSRTLDHRAGTLRVAALSAHYEQVWRMLGLQEVFPVFPSVNAALQPPAAGDIPGAPEERAEADTPAACAAWTETTP